MRHLKHILALQVLLTLFLFSGTEKPLTIVKSFAKSTATDTMLCAEVDRYFSATDGTKAKPYIKLTPHVHFDVTLSYDEICISGLKPRKEYTVSIRSNIPLGEVGLREDYQFSKKTVDYLPSLRFKENGYILPAKGEISLPIETTNINKLSLALYRINRDNLMGEINTYGLFRALSEYKLNSIKETDGYLLWEKKLSVASIKNQAGITAIPVGDALKKREPGVYILATSPISETGEIDKYNTVTQWFMISDIGLFSVEDSQGLHLYTKHLSDASTYQKVKLELVAKNNELLGSTVSKNGKALFHASLLKGKRGLQAKAIYAYGASADFTVLDLSRPAHDLSDRGVQGRDVPLHYDAFLYSNRGIFRPSEKITFHALLRDHNAHTVSKLALSATLYDARKVKIATKMLTSDRSGHIQGTFPISPSANTGRWKIILHAGTNEPVGTLNFLVEDFVPPKISVVLTQKPKRLEPNKPTILKAEAKLLTGDTLSYPHATVNTILHVAKTPFLDYPDYQFGDVRETFGNQSLGDTEFKGGAEGNITIPLHLTTIPHTSLPLSAHIAISINEPGGRPMQKALELFYGHRSAYIGIKPLFENHAIDLDSKARFMLAYLKGGQSAPSVLHYRLIEEYIDWNWRSDNGSGWEYYKTYSDGREIAKGAISIKKGDQLTLEKLDWGSYRLEVRDDIGSISTIRFGSGYEAQTSKASPDKLPLSTDKKQYHPDEIIRLHIVPKFTGPMLIMVANHRILEQKEITAKEGEALDINFKIKKTWGSSVYLLASTFRAQKKRLGAARAIGVAHISIHDPENTITLSITHPKRIRSHSSLGVTVHSKSPLLSKTYLTVSAVDKGILSLTDYQYPDPASYFYGQKTLSLRIRDIYGELIKVMGAHASFEVGSGDDALATTLNDAVVSNKRRVFARFSEMLHFDAEGNAHVSFAVPDFQGTLKLHAIAWNSNAVGSAHTEVLVKDPISPELFMPAFLSIGDRADSLLQSSIDASLPEGKYLFSLHSSGGIHITPSKISVMHQKNTKQTITQRLSLSADTLKDSTITLDVSYQDKTVASRTWPLSIRSTYPKSYVRKTGLLGKNENMTQHIQKNQWLNIQQVKLALSAAPLLPSESLGKELIAYGGRCNEQTSSRAFPWLQSKHSAHRQLIKDAIERITGQQRLSGGFGLWASSEPETWISAYVLDFLTRAKRYGYTVPEKNINAGLAWLEQHLDRWSKSAQKQEADAYALYVLTRNQHILSSEIFQRIDISKSLIQSAQAWGHLAATLEMLGEKKKAKLLFQKALSSLGGTPPIFYANYGGLLRDKASLVALLKEAKYDNEAATLFAELAVDSNEWHWLSTQEMSTLLRADHAIGFSPHTLHLSVDNQPYHSSQKFLQKSSSLATLPSIQNTDTQPVWYDLSFVAIPNPKTYSRLENHGFSLHKQLFSLEGDPIDLSQIRHHSRIVVLLTGEAQDPAITHPLITDWLGAGFEIENPILTGIDATDALKWLGKKTVSLHTEYRNDRFTAALNLEHNNSFISAYIVHAVTRGDFTLPPARIEDMYKPRYRAFSQPNTAKIHIKDVAKVESKFPKKVSDGTLSALNSSDYTRLSSQSVRSLQQYSILQVNYLRNGIFAQQGLDFSQTNPALFKRFIAYPWYKPTHKRSSEIYANMSTLQKKNIQKLLAEEKRRCGGLVLADFYRVRTKRLSVSYLKQYTKHELRILRNSLIARYGLIFSDPELQNIYKQMPWYRPKKITASDILDKKMNDLERANIQTILQVERGKQ